jgi:DNA-binding beta-propeller fold protein YncE
LFRGGRGFAGAAAASAATLLAFVVPTAPAGAAGAHGAFIPVPAQPTAWVLDSPGGHTVLVGIDVATDAIVGTIKIPNSLGDSIGATPGVLAITPNGHTAYLAIEFKREVVAVNLAKKTLGTPIRVSNEPVSIAITPNGSRAYVLGYSTVSRATVVPIDTSNGTTLKAIGIGPLESAGPGGIAVTPNGKTVLAASSENGTVTPISVATGKTGNPITVGAFPTAIAVTPNGKTAWVANSQDDDLAPVDLANDTVGKKVKLSGGPNALSITPNGGYLFVTLSSPASGAERVGLSGSNPVKKFQLLDPVKTPAQVDAVAIDPAGGTAFFGDSSQADVMGEGVSTLKQTASLAIVTGVSGVSAIAITPDEAPTAAFTVGKSGLTVHLDGSSSSAHFGTIVRYSWTFGDGATSHSAGAMTSHTYKKSGKYTVTLVVTDSLGTSTTVVFTGQTVSRNGGPKASKSTAVSVS